ncbi:hypothetical protein CJF40_10805 [Pseudomonas lundensis]|jgi:hypothetical protein|uniref:Integrase n=1 Tax=Pseudomonas lundensis TaxID=86185 RepID=A0ABX4GNX2_9PSED|nr:hypothetical protein [Pseudomonas lundensis]NMZ55362.1 hypothetical protein [Pseudomonas lundensis]NNA23311.1 hypothetical protein [Pseudomonas lundensis]NNA27477.1 hypothetical protein [Pseudomonas lundensis]OZY28352.1 hypothetical protein CJF40_10805 [Pseudomonas lundensis]OZY34880.1 hypothetical protein CJF35_22235 [Pseudomonas lundensis]
MNSWQRFEHRPNTRIITPGELSQEFSEPEFLRLQLSSKVMKKSLDIGSLAYFIRGKNERASDSRGVPVVTSSFVEGRREMILRLMESWVGMRDHSVLNYFIRTEYLVNWLNESGYKEIFASEVHAQQAYRDFTKHLNHCIHMQQMKPVTAYNYQISAISVVENLYPESSHKILSGAIRINPGKGSPAPSADHVELYKDVFLAIARQCADFVINNKKYPCVINVRDYEVVVYPSTCGTVGPFKEGPPVYNAAEHRISTLEEYMDAAARLGRHGVAKRDANRTLAKAEQNLVVANGDARNWHRFELAGLAAKAYAGLFLLITGASPTEFGQFYYEDALEVIKSPLKKELSAVKFRAGGKSNFYNIGRENGLPLLKEYLKLREWILNGERHDRLFFSWSKNRNSGGVTGFGELPVSDAMGKFYKSIRGVFLGPNLPSLSPRKMRKHKSNELHFARMSPSTVAASLNHSEEVNLSTYAVGTPEQQQVEFGQFWESMRHAAYVLRERSQKAAEIMIATAAGHCDGFNQPAAIAGAEALVKPNCRTQYGCLYCEHYVCHSDEEDLHKLLSLQYVVNAVRTVAPDFAHAETLFKELSIRIEFIIDALSERSGSVKQTAEKVKAKVFEYGELTAFWEARLSRYEKIGVVF